MYITYNCLAFNLKIRRNWFYGLSLVVIIFKQFTHNQIILYVHPACRFGPLRAVLFLIYLILF